MVGDGGLKKLDRSAETVQPSVVLTQTDGPEHVDEEAVENQSPDASTTSGPPTPKATEHSTAAENASGFAPGLPGGKRIALGLVLCCLLAWGLSAFQKRSADESLFRKCMDEAQLIDLKNVYKPYPEKSNNPYWKNALSIALQLGENKRVLADLNVRAASAEQPDDAGRSSRRVDLENAVSLYSQVSNTDSQHIKAINSLVFAIVPPLSAYNETPDFGPLLEDGMDDIDAAVKQRQLPKALTLCKTYVAKSHSAQGLANDLRLIASQLKVNDHLIPSAIPVFEDCVYYCSKDIDELKDEYFALEDVLKKGGIRTDRYADLLKLARSALAKHDDHGAFIYLQRCLGDHQDESLKKELLKVKQSIAKADYNITRKDVLECMDLLKTLRVLQVNDFGETNSHVLNTDRQLCYLNAWLGNYDKALRLLELHVAKSSPPHNDDDLIFDMCAIYSAEGKCSWSIALLRERTRNDLECVVDETALYFQSGQYQMAGQALKAAHDLVATPGTLPWAHIRR